MMGFLAGFGEGLEDGGEVVGLMEGEDLPAEGLPFGFQGVSIEDGAGIAVNLLVVSVYDGDQVIYPVVGGEEGGFPDLAFVDFAIAEYDIDFVGVVGEPFAQGIADSYGEALAERAGSDSYARKAFFGGRVTLQTAINAPKGCQLRHRKITPSGQHTIPSGTNMSIGKNEDVLSEASGVPGVGLEPKIRKIKSCQNVRHA